MRNLDSYIADAVRACPFSNRIIEAGFTAQHNGGGCLHWVKPLGDGWELWLGDVDSMDLGGHRSEFSICKMHADLEESDCPNVGEPETLTLDWCLNWASQQQILANLKAADEAFKASFAKFAIIRDAYRAGGSSDQEFNAAYQAHAAVYDEYDKAFIAASELPEEVQS